MSRVVKRLGPICVLAALPVFAQSQLMVTTASPLPNAALQVSYSVQLNATGGQSPYLWSTNSDLGAMPPGLSLSRSGSISGTPTQAGTFSFGVIVADSEKQPQFANARLSITVQSISITSSSPLPNGTAAVNYSYVLNASGGTLPYTWTLTSGNLPPGLSLSASGQISGTPGTPGTYQFAVSVTDSLKGNASGSFTITIQAGALTITSTSPLPNGAMGVSYSFSFAASGGNPPYTWSLIGGAVAPGLSLASTGVLSGTPTATGLYNFTVQVSYIPQQYFAVSAAPPGTTNATKTFSLRIAQPLTVTTASPLYGTQGSSLNLVMTVTGGAGQAIWQVANGSQLPPGLTLDTISGFLQGTPTAAGTYNFTVQATDTSGNVGTKALVMIVAPPIAITTASPAPAATAGSSYSLTLAASGGNPPYTWKLDSGALPVGISLDPVAGTLSGTPQSNGMASFAIRVTDTVNATVVKNFSLTVGQAAPGAQVSTTTLNFSALAGGDAPPPQSIALISLSAQALTFTIQTDGGIPGSPASAWISVRFPGGSTPAGILVAVDQTGLQPGSYSARVLINTSDGRQYIVTVNLTVTAAAQTLDVSPTYLRFAGSPSVLASAEQDLVVRNTGGGGVLAFEATVVGDTPWLSVSPSSGQAAPNSPGAVRVLVNAQSLAVGARRGLVRLTSAAGTIDVSVSLLVRGGGPVIGFDLQGARFDVRAGNGNALVEDANVLNLGDGLLNWRADIVSGGDWLSLGASSGQVAPGAANDLLLSADPGTRAKGAYYALIRITDPNALNSPQYFMVVLNVAGADTPPTPQPVPEGLVFVTRAGATPPSQALTIYASSSTPVPYQGAANTSGGGTWLSVSPLAGMTSSATPGRATVSINTAGLAAGVYTGSVTYSLSSTAIQTTNVTLIVQPPLLAAHLAGARDAVPGCTPAKLALTSTGLNNSFTSPAGWPTPLAVALSDDCGSPITNGQVVTTFSNGDPPLVMKLSDPNKATYSATWSPGKVASAVTVTARASAPSLASTSADILGAVTANKAPVLSTNGTLNNLFPVVGAPLAPGTVAEIFGSGLASSDSQPNTVPLPSMFNGTQALVGAFPAPLYFLSDGQLDVQLPMELKPDQDYPIIIAANGGFTLPDTITTAAASPAIAVNSDGSAIAQHASDFTLITPGAPATQGEAITLYLVGMGATSPPVASAVASPTIPPAQATAPPTVTIGGQQAQILFAGLTPAAVGLYQINLTVPRGLTAGQLPVVITQAGVAANAATLSVR